jgi:hypothetical protein
MERYQIGERPAFAMLRDHARHNGLRLVGVAQAVFEGRIMKRQLPDVVTGHPRLRFGVNADEPTPSCREASHDCTDWEERRCWGN